VSGNAAIQIDQEMDFPFESWRFSAGQKQAVAKRTVFVVAKRRFFRAIMSLLS
jgi:hypothetical protein